MAPWLTIVVAGAAIAGYGWLLPRAKPQQETAVADEEAYDRLLGELETENRELVDAVANFKQEQDETVARLGRRIQELEKAMSTLADQAAVDAVEVRAAAAARAAAEIRDEVSLREAASARESASHRDASGTRETGSHRDVADTREDAAPSGPAATAAHRLAEPVLPAEAELRAPAAEAPTSIRGRYAELLGLHDRGRSVEQIAKAMNMNKGEVQLILQLARREEERHA
ncbi:hypothetical protein [Cohnella nanjingensis]|uniref:DUF2802 domain-containing protein n=1 Tax=Cohnella nanjingensis TaxID=1387779 RepID=A0A7X0RXL6_9BACL|nr:hypothetical protein [Cohnella nanjingensis]MBB6675539.1 hypothetical protein [Cohnella nanjingensis]